MAKIRILPEHIANQIAAGEVVERPASVVKELVENSLDGGADTIEVEIEGGGTRLIRIIDNGEGMDEDDVLMSFERHGTSKISGEDSLFSVKSLGFRGEAIPSIASVSKMQIISRRPGDELGTAALSVYGSIKKVHEIGTRPGTIIEVANLFSNTPARKKFLRTARTELSHIDDTVKSYALARPDVSFLLRIDGRETIRLEQEDSLAGRLRQLLKYQGDLIEIDSGSPGVDRITVSGLLVPPESASPVAGRLRLMVNGRVIKDRLLIHAVNEGLRSFMLKGRQPAGVVKVELPPESVDVNVHPAKHEVRFKDGRTVHRIVSEAVREAMLASQQPLRAHLFYGERPNGQSAAQGAATALAKPYHPLAGPEEPSTGADQIIAANPARPPASLLFAAEEQQTPLRTPPPSVQPREEKHQPVQVEDLLVIGQFDNLYIFCRNHDRFIVIDQHAAHERLIFEDLRKQYLGGRVAAQNLLFPVTLELTVYQSQLVEANLDQLEAMGFSLRDFGGTTWVLAAVPALAGNSAPQELFFDIVEQFGSEARTRGGEALDTILATMACKAAVKSGDALSDGEIRGLLERMAKADLFSHCPHGRPVVKIFTAAEIKKWFDRT